MDLPQPTFSELMDKPTKLREDMLGPLAKVYDAYLRYNPDPNVYLGVGSFKTTAPARLTFSGNLPPTGLGKLVKQMENSDVALKRPYRNKKRVGGGRARMAFADEEKAVFEEGKLLVWANSLLKFAYDYINDYIDKQASPPPFEVLKFRFVEAAMAIAHKPLDNTTRTPTSSRAAYLLEEVLPGKFVKYLHNANASSELPPNDPNYHLAEFLMFIQHVQYVITGGVAYVSDFQGMT
jgi:hypothetical protein